MTIYDCTDVTINGTLKFLDNPGFHVKIDRSTKVTISDISIQAPGDSPNTDGIHVEGSSYVTIQGATIGTGFHHIYIYIYIRVIDKSFLVLDCPSLISW